jgi:2,4'-dihydroxyacetophenone dioxygenase
MPITVFQTVDDGLRPEQRLRREFAQDTNLDEEKQWVPYVEGAWFLPCQFNTSSGGFTNILRIAPGAKLPPHYHVATVHGFTLRGSWRYLEHEWVAKAGTYIFEPPGEAHTLVVDKDDREPMITFFVLSGGLIYVDDVKHGKVVGYDDGFTLLELARKHYRNVGLPLERLDKMIR